MADPTPSLISSHPSTSGLSIALHPLALLTISDYITRHTLRQQSGPIIGALIGTQTGRDLAIEHAYEVLTLQADSDVSIEPRWFEQKLKLFKETHPTTDLLGWFTTTPSPAFTPSPAHAALHKQLLQYNESLIMLLLNPSPAATVGGGGKLPLAIYESMYEADESGEESGKLRLKFVPLKYTVETGEAEMIAVDFVAKGGFGNAGAVSAVVGEEKGKKAEEKKAEGKGKGKGKAREGEEEKVDVGTQNDELLANLTAKRNATNMLHSRLRLLLSYLKSPPADPASPNGQPNHEILRALWSLTNSRLPLVTPANTAAFRQEKLAEESDVNLVALLGALTKSIEEVRSVGRKFNVVEQATKQGKRGPGMDAEGGWGRGGRMAGNPFGSGGNTSGGLFG